MTKKLSEDCASSCAFTYSDGRQCRSLPKHNSKHCLPHERKLRRLREEEGTAAFVAEPLESNKPSNRTRLNSASFASWTRKPTNTEAANALRIATSSSSKSLCAPTASMCSPPLRKKPCSFSKKVSCLAGIPARAWLTNSPASTPSSRT
jgi:hypothetical protein